MRKKVTVKLPLGLIKYHATKTCGGMEVLRHAFLISALGGDERSASRVLSLSFTKQRSLLSCQQALPQIKAPEIRQYEKQTFEMRDVFITQTKATKLPQGVQYFCYMASYFD
jgi:hypothetical protein